MTLVGETVQVYELTQQWRFTVSANSISGTRIYLGTNASLSTELVDLPNIGDEWSDDYPNVTLKTIDVTYINDNDNCGKRYVCSYDGTPYEQTAVIQDSDEFPRNVSVSGEFIVWEPKDNIFKWGSDLTVADQVVFKHVATATFRIVRVVKDFDDYMYDVAKLLNKVNGDTFLGFPAGTVLFNGANMTEFRNRVGSRRWRAELTFTFRTVTGDFGIPDEGQAPRDGWNYFMRNDTGKFDSIFNANDNSNLYSLEDFTDLFEGHALGSAEDLFNAFPDQ